MKDTVKKCDEKEPRRRQLARPTADAGPPASPRRWAHVPGDLAGFALAVACALGVLWALAVVVVVLSGWDPHGRRMATVCALATAACCGIFVRPGGPR